MSSVRESELLARIYASSRELPSHVKIGPGDDMALIELSSRRLLAAVDQVVEGRHFAAGTSAAAVGRKAVTRNLSDVAAMAARPAATLAACTLSPRSHGEWAAELFESIRTTSLRYGAPLIGGDISVHGEDAPTVIAVTILAEPMAAEAPLVTRGAARAGDSIYVTGELGGSLDRDGGGRHLTFEPRVNEAMALLAALGAELHSMIDVSDGLGRDAAQLASPHSQILLDAALIPCSAGCDWRRALSDGEDYELCFAAAAPPPSRVGGIPVRRIGSVRPRRSAGDPACVVLAEGRETDASALGWEHRAPERSKG